MVLYGIAATLFAYCVSLVVSSPLAAFAATAGIEVVMFIVSPVAGVWERGVADDAGRPTWRGTCSS
jgi:hypothetical protein